MPRFIWDFVLTRQDGKKVVLHPQHTSTKIQNRIGHESIPATQPPAAGIGMSDYKGQYQKKTREPYGKADVRFDARAKGHDSKGRAQPRQ